MASLEIPALLADRISPYAKDLLEKVHKFVHEECIPADALYVAQMPSDPAERFHKHYPQILDSLKAKARSLGLWNLFLSKRHYAEGVDLTNVEYALMAEIMGKSLSASEAMNCSAPDTGNMEVLAKYGNKEQKERWLKPLLNGEIRSAFVMTERFVASSDAKNICLDIKQKGNEWVLNGSKWWSSGAGDPRCKFYLVMGKNDAQNPDPYKQQSVVIVPADTRGIEIKRALTVFGYDDAPHGHCEIHFNNVRVPLGNMVLGPGRGFEIIQGRLGPGRIHHCMRAIGMASSALDLMLARLYDPSRSTFNKPLHSHGSLREWVARSRIEITSSRLLVLNAAQQIDVGGAKSALRQIAMAKVVVPNMALTVIDRAMQVHGAAGISQDFPLARMWANARTLRLADGPDEVHLDQLGRLEGKRADAVTKGLEDIRTRTEKLVKEHEGTIRSKL